MENEIKEFIQNSKLSLLTVLCNATQIWRRSIPKEKQEVFKENLSKIILNLLIKIDSNTLKNKDVRMAIKDLSSKSGLSIGVSQKPINVYLKFYCAILNKIDLLNELDCPIDSIIKKKQKLRKIALKNLELKDYIEMQEILRKNHTIQILADKYWDEFKLKK